MRFLTGEKTLLVFTAILAALLCAANIWFGNLNMDEGWYLYAARSYAEHARYPYRDYFFTQAPLLPVVYGVLSPLWSGSGILGGRLLTAIFGLLGTFFAAATAVRVVGDGRKFATGLTVFMLLACNVSYSYFTVIPKTYALASCLLMAGFYSLSRQGATVGRIANACWGFVGGFLLAGAAATRLSLGGALIVVGLFMLFDFRRRYSDWLAFGVGGLSGLVLMIGVIAAKDFGAFCFANFFHGGRAGMALLWAAGSLSRLVRNYMPIFLLLLATVCIWGIGRTRPSSSGVFDSFCRFVPRSVRLWGLAFGFIFVVHLLSPFPYEDYQTPLMPLFACAASVVFWNVAYAGGLRCRVGQNALLAAFLICSFVFAFTSPCNESWVTLRKDRFWVEKKTESSLARLRRVAAEIRHNYPHSDSLLTTDTYLAVEAGLSVPPGFEMGPFGFFPSLSDADARRYHVLNGKLLEEAVESSSADVAAFSGYGLAIAAPAMIKIEDQERAQYFETISKCYEKVANVPDFGQEFTTLEIWKRK